MIKWFKENRSIKIYAVSSNSQRLSWLEKRLSTRLKKKIYIYYLVLRHFKAYFVQKSQVVSRFNGKSASIIYGQMQGLRHRVRLWYTTKEAHIAKTYNAMHLRVGLHRGCSTRGSFGATWRSVATLGHGCLPASTGSFPRIHLCLCDAMTTWQTKFIGTWLCLLVSYSGPPVRSEIRFCRNICRVNVSLC